MPDKVEVEDVLKAVYDSENTDELRHALLTATEELAAIRDAADDALNDTNREVN